ncbi:hypothetical protein HDU98_008501 [Podochytrium sp. JEL0797]|nr:hypothetical protein HDU98_008501 [Podochytrium sp. JEL0797]
MFAETPIDAPLLLDASAAAKTVPPPKKLSDSLAKAEEFSSSPNTRTKAVPLFFGSAKALAQLGHSILAARALTGLIEILAPLFHSPLPQDQTGLTPAQIKETLFQAQFALARILSLSDPAKSLALYADALTTKFKGVDMAVLMGIVVKSKGSAKAIQAGCREATPATQVALDKLLIHASEVSRVAILNRGKVENALTLALISGCLVAAGLIKKVGSGVGCDDLVAYFKYCGVVASLRSGDAARIDWLVEYALVLRGEEFRLLKESNEWSKMSALFLMEALVESVEIDCRVWTKRILGELTSEDAFQGIQMCAFAIKFATGVCAQDDMWLSYEAAFELYDALESWRVPKLNSSLSEVPYLLAAEFELDRFNIANQFRESLDLVLSRLHGITINMFQNRTPVMKRSSSTSTVGAKSTRSALMGSLDTVFNGRLSFGKRKESVTVPPPPPQHVPNGRPLSPPTAGYSHPRDSSLKLKIVTQPPDSPPRNERKLSYPKYVSANSQRKASVSSNNSNLSSSSSRIYSQQNSASPDVMRRHEKQREMWLVYTDWLIALKNDAVSPCFSDYEQTHNMERGRLLSNTTVVVDANGNFHTAPLSGKKMSFSRSSRGASPVSNTTFNPPSSPTLSSGKRSPHRAVSFGGNSVRSFDSEDSPTSVRMYAKLYPLEDVSNGAFDAGRQQEIQQRLRSNSVPHINTTKAPPPIASPNVPDTTVLLSLPAHHAISPTAPHYKRVEHLHIRPSNDFITALLAYKSHLAAAQNQQRRSTSPTHRTNHSISPKPSHPPPILPTLSPETQSAWESALRIRIPASDWSKLVQEILENSISVGIHQRRTYHEAKVYWDIVWRSMPLGCVLEDFSETPVSPARVHPTAACARCGNGCLETFTHFLWTCPVAIVLWKRLEWVVGAMAEGEVRKARAGALRRYGVGSSVKRQQAELWDYGVQEGRVSISLVDVLFCFPKCRVVKGAGGQQQQSGGPSERFVKTVFALHATALMSLVEMRAYPAEEESFVWSLFVARYEARREVEMEQKKSIEK